MPSINCRQVSVQSDLIRASNMYHQTHLITSSKLAQSWPPSAFPNSPNHNLGANPLSLLNDRLQVYPQICTIATSDCISQLARSRPPSLCRNLLNDCLQLHLQSHSMTASKCITQTACLQPSCSQDHSLLVALWTWIITTLECISKFTQWQPASVFHDVLNCCLQVHLHTCRIMASKCISNYARTKPPSVSPILHDHSLRVCHWIHSIVIFSPITICSQALPADGPDILCTDG